MVHSVGLSISYKNMFTAEADVISINLSVKKNQTTGIQKQTSRILARYVQSFSGCEISNLVNSWITAADNMHESLMSINMIDIHYLKSDADVRLSRRR